MERKWGAGVQAVWQRLEFVIESGVIQYVWDANVRFVWRKWAGKWLKLMIVYLMYVLDIYYEYSNIENIKQ